MEVEQYVECDSDFGMGDFETFGIGDIAPLDSPWWGKDRLQICNTAIKVDCSEELEIPDIVAEDKTFGKSAIGVSVPKSMHGSSMGPEHAPKWKKREEGEIPHQSQANGKTSSSAFVSA